MKRLLLAAALVLLGADLTYGQTCQAFVNGAKARISKNKWDDANKVLGENAGEPIEEDGERKQLDLTTGHLEQEDLFGVLDLRAAYAIRPTAQLHEASVAQAFTAWAERAPASAMAATVALSSNDRNRVNPRETIIETVCVLPMLALPL